MEKYYSKVKIENANIHPWNVPFSQFLLEETFSSILKETNSLKSIRVFVIPALDYPYCYKIELKNKLSYLTYKTSTKLKNTRIGYLNSSKTTLHNDSIFINFSNKLSEIDFKKVSKDTTTYGWTDGFELFVEEFDSGNYRYCHIRNPFGSDDANTLKLWSTIKLLFEFE